tara:strand:+ start:711 stop:1142 length:432 start_codon:yes stop_codon:yes gene_type:complete
MLLGNAFRAGIYVVILNLLMTYVVLHFINKASWGSPSTKEIEDCNKKNIIVNGAVDFIIIFLAVLFGKLIHIGKSSKFVFAVKCAFFAILLQLLSGWFVKNKFIRQYSVPIPGFFEIEECKYKNLGTSVPLIGTLTFFAVLFS